MKEPESYLTLYYGNLRESIIRAIEQAQKDAYNEAIEDAEDANRRQLNLFKPRAKKTQDTVLKQSPVKKAGLITKKD